MPALLDVTYAVSASAPTDPEGSNGGIASARSPIVGNSQTRSGSARLGTGICVRSAEAWERCRSGGADPTRFGIGHTQMYGLWFVTGSRP